MTSAFTLYSPLICPTGSRRLQRNLCALSAVSGNITVQYQRMLSWYIYIEEVNTESFDLLFPQEPSATVDLEAHKSTLPQRLWLQKISQLQSRCPQFGMCSGCGGGNGLFQCSRWNIKRNLQSKTRAHFLSSRSDGEVISSGWKVLTQDLIKYLQMWRL